MKKRYLEQYERVKRWYERLRLINKGKEHSLPSDYYQDEVYAFFINCYHLKDWIKSDPASKVDAKTVEKFVAGSEFLSVCGDVCNGSKHLAITNVKVDKNTKIGGRNFFLELGASLPIFRARYKVISGDKEYDAFDLATRCLEEWRVFLGK